jgi:hypothetical protein
MRTKKVRTKEMEIKSNEREIYSFYNKQMTVSKRCFLPARKQSYLNRV